CAEEARLAGAEIQPVFCRGCGRVNYVEVPKSDMRSGQWANLLEGMICPECGLNGRMRKFRAVVDEILELRTIKSAVIFECVTPHLRVLDHRVPGLIGCEYLGPKIASGTLHSFGQAMVRHEDLCDTSFASDGLDLVMHCDVLEHVPDMHAALSECLRI